MIKRIAVILGGLLLVLAIVAAAFAVHVSRDFPVRYPTQKPDLRIETTPERVARGKAIAQALCAGCHYDQKTAGLTGHHMVEAPEEFGVLVSRNITGDPKEGIGTYSDGELAFLLRTGIERDGVYPGPFMAHPHASDEDVASLIAFLRSDDPLVKPQAVPNQPSQPAFLFKLLDHVAWKPSAYPQAPVLAPLPSDRVAYGHYLAVNLFDCYVCHSADFKTLDTATPEHSAGFFGGGNPTLDADHHVVLSANLTPDESGLAGWSEAQFVRAVREGFRPDNRPLRFPMEPIPSITPDEASAIWAYLQTVPKLHHPLNRWTEPPPPATASAGEKVYDKYYCASCHGAGGAGVCDLRGAFAKYHDEAGVTAFIRDPQKFVPGTKMPAWDGVLLNEEFPPLLAYIRELGKTAPKR